MAGRRQELLFAALDGTVMSVDVTPGTTLSGQPTKSALQGAFRYSSQLGRHR